MTRTLYLLPFVLLFGCSAGMQTVDAPSIQIGRVAMPHAERPTPDSWTLVYQVHVAFPREFSQIPRVQLAMSEIEAYSRKSGVFYRLEADQVTKSGFTLRVFGAYMDSFSTCAVSWTATE